ncbi:ferredoxin family protein [Novosphingobium mangrovi (ex Hu et al. 2023)]|uniref:Ferredoxin-like protein n=1 Tax=Novosphingobium mangrovi (ex Hu et al. 2023) TaxID=2930094 RepID=A0ABT0ACF1_9SPHN|nr:ferredoxin family protein [Novosphingobium mangrovi (ex Hu et al. 2023)]MCJ1960839.1 ferredoxin family protein [Novosphingobium mangrovi (ex Hu et al. 2023)]
MTEIATAPKVEEKLFQNRYLVDAGKPHIRVREHETPSASLLAMTRLCPAGCYAVTESGQVEVAADGCLECGTCRIVTRKTGEVEWNYPRGGFGVLYKFG